MVKNLFIAAFVLLVIGFASLYGFGATLMFAGALLAVGGFGAWVHSRLDD